jgi:hypothetical protein
MNHDSDLIAVFAVLFFVVMLWAYVAKNPLALHDFTYLGTAQSGYIETDGE